MRKSITNERDIFMQTANLMDIPGIRIGNTQDDTAGTGCTVILCENGAAAGVDVRGGSPGTRETDLLNPVNMQEKIHAVMLSGGSAFGLDAAGGVMRYLEERGAGFDVGCTYVPVVCGAVLFDLHCGDFRVRPGIEMGYAAAKNSENSACLHGCVGAGTGASIGKYMGEEYAMKGGLGSFCVKEGSLLVGAVVAVNCLGDVFDPEEGRIIAGTLYPDPKQKKLGCTEDLMIERYAGGLNVFNGNTTIGCIITNADLSKGQMNKLASMAHNGYARSMRPAHSIFDGDTIFTLSTGGVQADINVVGLLAARVMERAVVDAVKSADSRYGLLAYGDLTK